MDAGTERYGLRARSRSAAGRALAAIVAASTVAVAAPLVASGPVAAAGCIDTPAGMATESEARLVAKLNDLRRSEGLPALEEHPAVSAQARSWAANMGRQGRLFHARDTGSADGVEPEQDYVAQLAVAVPDWTRAAENIGADTVGSWCSQDDLRAGVLTATDALHRGFVASSEHRANMVDDHDLVGVGVHIDGTDLWVTVRFAKTSTTRSPSSTAATPAGRFVDTAYQLFLGRAASAADIERWSDTVTRDRGRLTSALAVSNEWAGGRVAELYRTVLDREPDARGQQGWVAGIAGGMRLEDVAAGFYGSQERFDDAGRSHRGYIDGLYRDILGRPADAAGLADWVGRLDRGAMTRTQVAGGFYGSLESRTTRVRALYDEVLGRAPDAGGLAHWVRQLSTMGDVVLASTLASSSEFWQRSTR